MVAIKSFPSTTDIPCENGVFIPLDSIEHFKEEEYFDQTIEHYQTHPNQVPYDPSSHLPLFHIPTAAVIVGTGTVGLEAIVYASRILPLQSTLIILQNDVEDTTTLEHLLKSCIEGGKNFNWIISPPIDLGHIDKIEYFLDQHKNDLTHVQLFIHTADKAKRYIPDRLHHQDVIAQIIRRCSIPAIEEKIEQYADSTKPYVRILFSSICSTNRDKYRLANIGPYQLGKIVGDELFKSRIIKRPCYSFILYSGGMFTMGETLTRNEEFRLLKNSQDSFKKKSEKEYHEKWATAGDHVDSMDSAGLMFKKIWQELKKNALIPGKLYAIYGSSVPQRLGHPLNTLKVIEPAPYMCESLESIRE